VDGQELLPDRLIDTCGILKGFIGFLFVRGCPCTTLDSCFLRLSHDPLDYRGKECKG
jgi:hypothetical protein